MYFGWIWWIVPKLRNYVSMIKIAFTCFLIFLYSLCLFSQVVNVHQRRDSIIQVNMGKPYPEFIAKDVVTNGIITEKKMKGKVTLLNFWFKACHPCVEAFSKLNDLNDRFEHNQFFQIISLTFDPSEDVKKTIEEFSLNYTICSITRDECYRLNFESGFPAYIIVDKSGNFSYFFVSFDEAKSKIEELLELIPLETKK